MNARPFLILLLILTTLLASCDDKATGIAAVESVLSKPTPEARREEVVRQTKALCPVPLDADEVEWVAQFVEENHGKGAIYVAGLLWKMNAETRLCRGLKKTGA
ncbi:MAG: hypothetical protein FJX40_13905 [Alphaproteobacteria bacterium]|nr:hypothetical protein [Alphaproteobacteria bacterium]MBM3641848.1 hypothetical protein [Alphaproteobacteria bacterium]